MHEGYTFCFQLTIKARLFATVEIGKWDIQQKMLTTNVKTCTEISSPLLCWLENWIDEYIHSQWMHAHKSYVISLSSCIVNWSVRSTSFINYFLFMHNRGFFCWRRNTNGIFKNKHLRVKYKKHASNTASLNVNLYIVLNRFWENLVKNLFFNKKGQTQFRRK